MAAPVSENIVWHHGVSQEQREELTGQRGVTIWFTGLSGQSSRAVQPLNTLKWQPNGSTATVSSLAS